VTAQHRGGARVECGGGVSGVHQLVGGQVAASGREGERPTADVPSFPGQVGVGTGVEQHGEDGQPSAAGDGVVQAAFGVDIDTLVEEPLEAGGVLEVELV